MKEMFNTAYFGKAYKTRNGKKAIYVRDTNMHRVFVHELVLEDGNILCSKYGKVQVTDCDWDVVSEWSKPPIDEMELTELAFNEWYHNDNNTIDSFQDGFVAGYRRATKDLININK